MECYDSGMYQMLAASFEIILRRIPSRSFLREISFIEALGVYILTTVLGLTELLFPALGDAQAETGFPMGLELTINILGLLLILFVGMWVINRYARDRFTLKEMFVLEVLLTSGSGIVFSISWIAAVLFGMDEAILISVLSLVFGIYMLLTFQKAISEIATITKSQAAYVILAPIAVFLVVWMAFLVLAGGVAANSYLSAELRRTSHVNVFSPSSHNIFCTDNAAMIAAAGFFAKGPINPLELQADPNLSL